MSSGQPSNEPPFIVLDEVFALNGWRPEDAVAATGQPRLSRRQHPVSGGRREVRLCLRRPQEQRIALPSRPAPSGQGASGNSLTVRPLALHHDTSPARPVAKCGNCDRERAGRACAEPQCVESDGPRGSCWVHHPRRQLNGVRLSSSRHDSTWWPRPSFTAEPADDPGVDDPLRSRRTPSRRAAVRLSA
jgi:hypothetical protein